MHAIKTESRVPSLLSSAKKKSAEHNLGPIQKKTAPKLPVAEFSVGDRVHHVTFGDGTVLSKRTMGSDILYEIEFDKVGIKKLMATYARLSAI